MGRLLPLVALAVLSLVLAAACGGGEDEEPVASPPPTEPAPASQGWSPVLQGSVWEWHGSAYNDGSEAVPDDPARYTIEFAEDGTVSILADCNRVGGTYEENDGALTIALGPATRAACPEDSLDEEFLRDLEGAAIAFFDEAGTLRIDIKFDTGTMAFEPAS